jgi:6-phospho-beta-glucosidase
MARVRIAYIGGGSTRAPGVAAGLIARAEAFAGSEVALIDLDADRLGTVIRLAQRMAAAAGADIRFQAVTDRRIGLRDADIVLSSFRPGGFKARRLDELIPLKHGVIGQETQGPGGFFMALRAIHALRPMLEDMAELCPSAHLLNYTNPVNIVAEAVSRHAGRPVISLCEGPIIFPREVAEAAGLDPDRLDVRMIGLNHGSWSVRHLHDGEDFVEKVRAIWAARRGDPALSPQARRLMHMTALFGSVPAQYFKYYYFRDEILNELRAAPLSRAETIMAEAPGHWTHYEEQAAAEAPRLDPAKSRGGMDLLEIAVDVMDAIANDRHEIWPVNVPNRGAIAGLPDDLVVEVPGLVDRFGAQPLACGALPGPVRGMVLALAEYQRLTADAAWNGNRRQAIRALASNPLVPSLPVAEALYDEMAAAHRAHLPARLLA